MNVLVFPTEADYDEANYRLARASVAYAKELGQGDLEESGKLSATRYTKTQWETNDGRWAFPLSRVERRLKDSQTEFLASLFADIGQGSVLYEVVSLDFFRQNLEVQNDDLGKRS